MEITASTIYWIMQLDHIHGALVAVLLVCGLGSIPVIGFSFSLVYEKHMKPFVAYMNTILIVSVFIIAGCFKIFLPSTKTAIAMYTIPKLLNSQAMYTLEGDAKELYKLGVERLKSELKEEIRK